MKEIEILREEVTNLKKQVDIYSREINEMIDMEVSEAIKLEKQRKESAYLERQLEESKECQTTIRRKITEGILNNSKSF